MEDQNDEKTTFDTTFDEWKEMREELGRVTDGTPLPKAMVEMREMVKKHKVRDISSM